MKKVHTWSSVLCIQKYSVLYHNFNLRKINIDHPSCHVTIQHIISTYILISNFMKINQDIMSTYILISSFMKINQDIISTSILISNFMKINQNIINTYILISNFMKINQDIISTYILILLIDNFTVI